MNVLHSFLDNAVSAVKTTAFLYKQQKEDDDFIKVIEAFQEELKAKMAKEKKWS